MLRADVLSMCMRNYLWVLLALPISIGGSYRIKTLGSGSSYDLVTVGYYGPYDTRDSFAGDGDSGSDLHPPREAA
jgi:hypothetical protein